jgi:hypothetical protein
VQDGLHPERADDNHNTRDQEYGVRHKSRRRVCMHYLRHEGAWLQRAARTCGSGRRPVDARREQQRPAQQAAARQGVLTPHRVRCVHCCADVLALSRRAFGWVHCSAGGWLLATSHIITAIIGAGVLGLPYALSWLGWAGGIACLLVFYAITLWSSLLLTECHETDGVKHETYRAAVRYILGEAHTGRGGGVVLWGAAPSQGGPCLKLRLPPPAPAPPPLRPHTHTGPGNAAILSLFQYLNLILSSIGYTVAAGQSLRIIVGGICSRSRFDACYNSVWQMALGFGACQLLLSQMPSLESAWWSSIIGATMSFMYSTCALALGASQGGQACVGRGVPRGGVVGCRSSAQR